MIAKNKLLKHFMTIQKTNKIIPMTFLVLGLHSPLLYASTPVEKQVPVDHVYSPKGFDSNDNVEIVISGNLPNLCHRSPKTTVEVVGNTIQVQLTSLYYESSNPFCPEITVPFLETVSVGVLDKGAYQIVVNDKTDFEAHSLIQVDESTSEAIDDHVYAQVEYVEKNSNPENKNKVHLKGYNPSDCFILDRVESVSNGKDTYAILPIMKQVYSFCPMKMIPFDYEYEVPKDIQRKDVLLHVRSMEGKSINTLFNNL